jgi:hypothetical protein
MKRLLRAFLVLTFLFGQVAFALPGLSSPMDFGGNRHVNKSFVEHAHAQQGKHDAYCGGDMQCDHSCQGDNCCSGCSMCGHCSTVLHIAFQTLVSVPGYLSYKVILLPQDLHPSLIFQPPRSLS